MNIGHLWNKILRRYYYSSLNIEWPEGEEALSSEAVEAIMSFLRLDQTQRANGKTIKNCALMKVKI